MIELSTKNNINSPDSFGYTILHTACMLGNLDIVKLLIDAGANINVKNDCGNTPLCLACDRGHLNIINYFLTLE